MTAEELISTSKLLYSPDPEVRGVALTLINQDKVISEYLKERHILSVFCRWFSTNGIQLGITYYKPGTINELIERVDFETTKLVSRLIVEAIHNEHYEKETQI